MSLTVGLGAPTTLQFEIGDLDVPDRTGLNEIAFAAVDLLVSFPRNSVSFAEGQLVVFQGASDEHI